MGHSDLRSRHQLQRLARRGRKTHWKYASKNLPGLGPEPAVVVTTFLHKRRCAPSRIGRQVGIMSSGIGQSSHAPRSDMSTAE
ncbi:unnamed protein product [Protopolystoma xenopodis]|uniref:Uncharacterized protein n=1 Tax=Protopolystoma xenopodis TaxID=117903 RepID=A0A448X0Q7_9PLAT|nr:unnamed protein product [Protopolystoma xenopodis]